MANRGLCLAASRQFCALELGLCYTKIFWNVLSIGQA